MAFEQARLAARVTGEVAACCTLASLLEVNATPKPGNVHRCSDPAQHGKSHEQFLAAIAAMAPCHLEVATTGQAWAASGLDQASLHLGPLLEREARAMTSAQRGGNLLLGHVLLLVPLAAAAGSLVGAGDAPACSTLRDRVKRVTRSGTPSDVAGLYRAIQVARPGGMGTVNRFDVTDPGAIQDLIDAGATFTDAFSITEATDAISHEWVHGFPVTFTEVAPRVVDLLHDEQWTVNEAIVQVFMETLAARPDSLVHRKNDAGTARAVSGRARECLAGGDIRDPAVMTRVKALDLELAAARGKLNPGTTADLVAAGTCVALLLGYRP